MLAGQPLKRVHLVSCPNLVDLTPLAQCQDLEEVIVSKEAGNLEFLLELLELRCKVRSRLKQPVLSTGLIRKSQTHHMPLVLLPSPMTQAVLGSAARLWVASILGDTQHGDVLAGLN